MVEIVKIVAEIDIANMLAIAVVVIPLCFALTVYYLRK